MQKSILNSEKITRSIAQEFARKLSMHRDWGNVVLFYGEMGAGKTTFIRYMVEFLNPSALVNSPSFAIVQEYFGVGFGAGSRVGSEVDGVNGEQKSCSADRAGEAGALEDDKQCAKNSTSEILIIHADLFRGADGETLAYLRECMEDKNKIVLIEWAEKLPKEFVPKNAIKLHFEHGEVESERFLSAEFSSFGIPNSQDVKNLTDEFRTPFHVQKHERGVQKVALALADGMIKQGYILDRKMISASSLLHDLVRVCNFPVLPERISEGGSGVGSGACSRGLSVGSRVEGAEVEQKSCSTDREREAGGGSGAGGAEVEQKSCSTSGGEQSEEQSGKIKNKNYQNADNYQEEITEEKVGIWQEQKEKYGKIHHADAGGEILRERGFASVATLVEKHKSKAVFEGFDSLEEEIVYIADKKVLHDRIVSIDERLKDGRVRHNLGDDKKQDLIEKCIRGLAKKLIKMAGFESEEELD